MINIVVPMAGLGSRFAIAGYEKPKPFIDVLGKTMIERVMENIYIPNSRFILIGRKEHLEKEVIQIDYIKAKYPETVFLAVDP
jgi:CTP:phosphocholine cytidylyltransferase-like protein